MKDITEKGLQERRKNPLYGRHLYLLDSVDSTNRFAKGLGAQGGENGTAVLADTQTAGRGRLGRSFFSPSGCGLYLSLLLYTPTPPERLPLLTAAAAVAARRAIAAEAGLETDIKWVNDLCIGGKKVAGILCESMFDGTGVPLYSVVGIGINVKKCVFPPELRNIATSLEENGGRCGREALAARLLDCLYEILPHIGEPSLVEEYRMHSSLLGKSVFIVGEEKKRYRVIAIDDACSLILENDAGERHVLASGEVSVRAEG